MSFNSQTQANRYDGTGLETDHDFEFKIFSKSDLRVVKYTDAGVKSVLVLDTDYTIADLYVGASAGGTLVLAAALEDDYQLLIRRKFVIEQETDIKNQGGGAYLVDLEDALDKITMMLLTHKWEIERAIHVDENLNSETEVFSTQIDGDPTASPLMLLRVNDDSDQIELVDAGDALNGVVSSSDDVFAVEDGDTNENVTDMIVYGARMSSAQFTVEIIGTAIAVHIPVSVNKLDGVWSVSKGPPLGDGDPEVDFGVESSVTTDAQINVTSTANVGNRTLKWKKVGFNV